MTDAWLFNLWLVILAGLPLTVVIAAGLIRDLERLRRFANVFAGAAVLVSAQALLHPALADAAIAWPAALAGPLWGPSVVRTDALADLLILVVAILWLVSNAVTPRGRLDRGGVRRTAAAAGITIATFATESPILLAGLWVASMIPYLLALGEPQYRQARRVALGYLGGSTILFVVGVFVAFGTAEPSPVGLILVVVAALIRKGVFPFHAWVPELFEHGPLGPAILLLAPQLGSYVTVVLIIPHASADTLRVVAILALITAVYGAALATVQTEARRALGYLFVSQSALVMAGLDCTSEFALAGSMVLWVSSALAFTGMARVVQALEVRRGRLDLSRFHGGYEQTPMLALSFLVLGLACTGFPGTLGFIGEEMLVDGATEVFPVLGFFVVAAGALTGLAVLRMYFSLFTGRSDAGPRLPARPVERVTFAALAAALILTGLVPGPIVRTRVAAAVHVLEARHGFVSDPEPAHPVSLEP